MINNYDLVAALIFAGATSSQKEENTSCTATKRNWLSFVTLLVAMFCFSMAQGQTYLTESFESAWYLNGDINTAATNAGPNAPSGWTQTRLTNAVVPVACAAGAHDWGQSTWSSGTTWSSTSSYPTGCSPYGGTPNSVPAGTKSLWFYDGYTNGSSTRLISSPVVDLSVSTAPAVSFSYSYAGSAVVTLEGSLDGGTTWSTLSTISSTTSGSWVTKLVVIPSSYKVATAKFGFKVVSSYGSYDVFIDNVVIREAVLPIAPITFSTTALTSAGMTINWLDNSTNETAFKVYRSTDNVTFTQVGTNIASTTSAGTGTSYNQVQTGLLPNTTYYYRISSVFEAESAFLTGSQATNASGTFVSVLTGNFGTAATWDINTVPTQYDSVVISAGHTVTIDATGQVANNVTVAGTLTYGTTPTSFTANGNLTVNTGGVVNVFNGTTGKTLSVAGNITNNGTMDVSVGATTAGNLTLNGTAAQTVSGSGTFNTSVIRNLTFSNTSTAIPNINWGFNNISVDNNLNIANAKINLNNNKIIFGTSATSSGGTFTVTNGGFLNGTFSRWWSASAGGYNTNGPTSVPAGSPAGRYPFFTSTGEARIFYIGRTTASAGGKFAVTYNNATTSTSGQNITDGTYVVTDRWDGNFVVTTDGTSPAAASYWVTIFAPNAFYTSAIGARIIGQSASISGTHVATSTLPIGQRSGVSLADLTSNTGLYLGVNSADIPFISVANGDWETASTWNKNAVPTATDIVYIANGTTVAINATAAVSNAMTIYAGGTLNVAGSTLGVTTSLTNNGTLNVSGGAMSTTTTVTNNSLSTITISGTGALTVGTTMTNNGTVNANAGNLTVTGGSATGISNSSTGTFVVAGGAVRQGPIGGGNTTFSNSGILTVSSGTLNINGNLSHSGTQFNQSGGNINLDPNAAGITSNSSTSSNYTLNLSSSSTGSLNWTGGTLTIVDPPATASTSHYSIYYYMNAHSEVTSGHTLQFGDGISSEAGGAGNSFLIYNYVGSYKGNWNNIIVNGPGSAVTASSLNRIVKQQSYSNNIYGNLTINNNGEFDMNSIGIGIGNNLNVNTGGILTASGTLTLAIPSGTSTVINPNNAQSINGGGTIRNLSTSPTANLTGLQFGNSNSVGITLNTPLSVSGTLTMLSGIVNTTNTNLLSLGTATAAGTLSGTPSATNMVKGPFARTIATANANTNYILFPVGKAAYAPISIAPATTAVTVMKAEAFDSNTGTQNAAIINMTIGRRWEAPIVSGTVTDLNVRLGDTGILATSIPVQAPSASGQYTNSFGSVATAVAGATTQSNTVVTSANYTGFLSYANSNACSGTPAPGNTLASTNAICLGTSVTLSLQNATSGTGVTYQWKSSIDGIAYTAITGATNATLSVTPNAPLYYLCDVTCSAGPSTGTSTVVQITFSNSITATTPGTRCGTGTVNLSATPSTGTSVKWYATEIGGTTLGSGNSFTTPSIATTTTFYVGSESASLGTAQIGNGVTTSGTNLSAFNNYRASAKYHMIYTASELVAIGLSAGNITSIAYNVTSLGSAGTNANYTVKIGTTTLSTFANTAFTTPTFTTCYGPSTYVHTANGWQTINFTTPFNWDGTSNIIIEVSHDGIDASASANTLYTATTGNTVLYSYNASDLNNTLSTNRFNVLFAGQVACQSNRLPVLATVTAPPVLTLSASTAIICESDSTPSITVTSTVGDYNTYSWSPNSGVTGNESTGWVFNPSVSTVYTLTATQTSGSLCSTTATFAITVNPRPSVMSITPSPAPVCLGTVQSLVVTGGTLNNVSILNENFNASTNSWTLLNASTGGTPADAEWTLRNSGYVYSTYGTFSSNDASQFYLSNSDDQGSGGTTNTTLISPSFATTNFTAATVSFWHYYRSSGTAKVQYSADGGTIWTDIQSFSATTGAIAGFVQANLVLPAGALNQANVKIRFKYDASWGYFWAIDNVSVSGTQTQPVTWLPITNLFSDAAATIPYLANTNASTVYFKSATAASAITYTATTTTALGCFRSSSVQVTVNTLPNVVTVAPTSVCFGSTVDLTASSVTIGSDSGLTFTYFTNALATIALTNPSAVVTSGTYYIKGTNANGCSVVVPVIVTVNPLPVLTITAPVTVCSPATVDITASAITAGSDTGLTLTYWSDSNATTALTTASAVTTSGTYYIKAVNANGCVKIMPVTVTINVTNPPTGTASQAFCGSANLSQLVTTGTNIKWYNAATGGTEYPASLWTLVGIVNGTTYYASQTVNGCESTTRFAVTAVVNPIPSAPNATAQTFCNSALVSDLLPNGSAYTWYDASTGGNVVVSTASISSGTYYVSQTVNGCESTRTAVTVTINTTTAPTASAQTFCNSALVANLAAIGTGLQWYSASTGGSALSVSTALATGTYFVSQTINGCESTRTSVVVTVNATTAPTATSQTFCSSGTVANLVATGSSLQWYSIPTGGSPIATNTALTSGIYYVSQTVNGCESTRTAVNVTISSPATPTGAATQTIFGGVGPDATIEDISVSGTNVIWYPTAADAAAGTNAIAAGTQLISGTTYYAVSVVGTCRSTPLAVTVTVVLENESFDIKSLKFYPNPVIDILTISYSSEITAVQVYDISGRQIRNMNPNSNLVTVDLSDLATSVYVVRVFANDTSSEFKVVKK